MTRTRRPREEMRAEFLAEAAARFDELFDWNDETVTPTLSQIEGEILVLRKRLSERLATMLIEAQETVRPVPGPACPECGREMHYKDMKGNTVESQVGTLRLERGYYHCQACKSGLFPPGPATSAVGEELERAAGQRDGLAERGVG